MTTAKREIKEAFQQAIDSLSNDYQGSSLTDIFVMVDEDSGVISIFDDEENKLVEEVIDSWLNEPGKDLIKYTSDLREAIEEMDDDNLFSSLDLYTPFSINLVDEDFIVQEELLLIQDDSVILIEDDFMNRMDKKFDEFLDKLLNE